MREHSKASASPQTRVQPTRAAIADHDFARVLCESVSEGSRLAFARSFAFEIIRAWWTGRQLEVPLRPLPADVERLQLSAEAVRAAREFGQKLANAEPSHATYLVGTVYTTSLPESYRGTHGIYYTPPLLVDRLIGMAERAGINWQSARVLDPSCGCGAFLLPLAGRMVAALEGTDPKFVLQQLGARLRGFDVDPFGAWLGQVTLEIALQDLMRAAGHRLPVIVQIRDSLDLQDADKEAFDLVIGNPPYGRITLPPERRATFARSVYGHANLYGLFTDAALHWVKLGGIVAYVTPTSMLSGMYYKALRSLLAAKAPPHEVNFVHERNGVFTDVLQETMLATYRRGRRSTRANVGFIEIGSSAKSPRPKGSIFTLPTPASAPWILPRSSEQTEFTNQLRQMNHRLADYGYGVSTGPLVWNRFKDQYSEASKLGSFPVIWAESVTSKGTFVWRSDRRNHSPWFVARRPKDNWLIVNVPCVLLQRTTAKEQPRRLIAAELPMSFIRKHKGVVVENHLNMVRPLSDTPVVSASVIAVLLNSAVVDDAFRCISGSVAVSAFELESLPMPAPAAMEEIAELVHQNAHPEILESTIARAYGRSNVTATA